MLAHDDPMERFLVRRPDLLLDKPVESATLNPSNPQILEAQLRCAAYERPISEDELSAFGPNAAQVADQLVDSGSAVWQAGRLFYPSHQSPARKVNIRGSNSESVLLLVDGQPLGEMEFWRALRQAHKGAVYLHRGQTYYVEELDLQRKLANLVPCEPTFYTLPVVQNLVESTVTIEEGRPMSLNGVRVTTSVPGFTKWSLDARCMMGEETLDLPVQSYETVGVRLDLTELTIEEVATVHALEHALSAVAPLIAGCDRNDLGSCWFVMCPETMAPAVYVFDSTPGGVGLSETLFTHRDTWLTSSLSLLESCPCVEGCPACLLSSRCESSNEGLDKRGAMAYLNEELNLVHSTSRGVLDGGST
jgi:DEAD/DEAH box helicase domain-containing protein